MRGIGRGVLSSHPLQSRLGSVDCRSNFVVCRFHSADVVDLRKSRTGSDHFDPIWEVPNSHVVTPENFNKLIVEIAYSANQALGDEMNVVQIRYDLVGSNTTCTP